MSAVLEAREPSARYLEAVEPPLVRQFDHLAGAPGGVARMRELILDLAIRGRLVPRNLNTESQLADVTVDDSGPFELPLGWSWMKLGALQPELQNGASSRGDAGGQPITVLRLADIKDRRVSLADTRQIPIRRQDIEKYRLQDGDILITRVNGSADIVGQFNLVEGEPQAIYCDHFIRMRVSRDVLDPKYLSMFGGSEVIRSRISNLFISTAGQKTVNQGHIGSLPIAIPPLTEQARIVARVDELMRLCDALEAKGRLEAEQHARLLGTLLSSLTDSTTPEELAVNWQRVADHFDLLLDRPEAVDALEQTILQLAVRGLLVPQDPSAAVANATEDEEGAQIPRRWTRIRLGDVVAMTNGYAFKSEWFMASGTRLVRNVNVSHGHLDWQQTACVSRAVADEFAQFALAEGDVVLTLDRPIISTGLKLAVVQVHDLPCLLLQRVARLSPDAKVLSSDFMLLWLRSDSFVKAIDPGRSNGVPHISTKQVAALTIGPSSFSVESNNHSDWW
ncbi:MAG: restriction endonuclease subunit S [Rubrivivax sp.]|nr:restriction endonuclease subunit S [Rubrivivax sp.]